MPIPSPLEQALAGAGLPEHVRLYSVSVRVTPAADARTEAQLALQAALARLFAESGTPQLDVVVRHHKPFSDAERVSLETAVASVLGRPVSLGEDLGIAAGLRCLRFDIPV